MAKVSIGEIEQPFTLTLKERAELKRLQLENFDLRIIAIGYQRMVVNEAKGSPFDLTDEQLFDLTLAGIQAQREQEKKKEEELQAIAREYGSAA